MRIIPLNALATLLLLIFILLFDFTVRRNLYNRSDPMSLTLMLYSFLLIVADGLLRILREISSGRSDSRLLILSLIYLALFFVIFLTVNTSHKNFQYAQERAVKTYLRTLSQVTQAPEAVWRALEVLGTEIIEPDLFRRNLSKQRRRIEYLSLVRKLTQADLDPTLDQEKLLVTDRKVIALSRLAYISAFVFAVVSTLVFFMQR
jgi:hypothetical protein